MFKNINNNSNYLEINFAKRKILCGNKNIFLQIREHVIIVLVGAGANSIVAGWWIYQPW